MDTATLLHALGEAQSALELIAAPARPDGTFNRDRRACGSLAREALKRIEEALAGSVAAPPPATKSATQTSGLFVVNTDGACKGNPGPAGWGVVVVNGSEIIEDKGYLGHATNQVAELAAAIAGLKLTPAWATVELVSDSTYVLKGLSEWRKGWERNGWRTSGGEPVKNLTYWKELFALWDARHVTTRWVKGHSGEVFNERCDALANQAIREART